MADIDIDSFSNHGKTEEPTGETTGETIPLTPKGVGGATWEPEHEQETSFVIESQRIRLMREMLKDYIENYLKDTNSLKKDISTCLKSEMENCIIKVWTNP